MSDFLDDLASRCPPETPFRFLRFTWFGDFACSFGTHYVPGISLPFEEILKRVNKEHSDDLVENLACWAVRNLVPEMPSLAGWEDLCWTFYELIKADYLRDPVRYSPDYPQLFARRNSTSYLQVITQHTNCGGAMRSASLAFGGATPAEHLALVGMTHLYPESLAGAYALYEAVRTLQGGGTVDEMWEAALEGAWQGEQQALDLVEAWGAEAERGQMLSWMQAVRCHQNVRYGIRDWYGEGITTRFVVSAALQIASDAIPRAPSGALRYVVEQGIDIGGDPDTLGSMGMALIGAHFGDALHAEIDRVIAELVTPENIEIPHFFR